MMDHSEKQSLNDWYETYLDAEDDDICEDALQNIEYRIQQNPQELVILQEIFSCEMSVYRKIELSKIFINLQHKDYVIPFLLDTVNEPESPTEDAFERLYAAILLTSVNHQKGKQVLRNLIYKEDLREENQKNNNQDSICSDLEDIIERMGKHEHNVYIKQLIHDCARSSKFARIFYERFYQEKIDDPEVDA